MDVIDNNMNSADRLLRSLSSMFGWSATNSVVKEKEPTKTQTIKTDGGTFEFIY